MNTRSSQEYKKQLGIQGAAMNTRNSYEYNEQLGIQGAARITRSSQKYKEQLEIQEATCEVDFSNSLTAARSCIDKSISLEHTSANSVLLTVITNIPVVIQC